MWSVARDIVYSIYRREINAATRIEIKSALLARPLLYLAAVIRALRGEFRNTRWFAISHNAMQKRRVDGTHKSRVNIPYKNSRANIGVTFPSVLPGILVARIYTWFFMMSNFYFTKTAV